MPKNRGKAVIVMERLNILVTGASGFLGQALTEKLLSAGHRVYALSRHPPVEREGLVPLTGDVCLPGLGMESPPPKSEIDSVYHCAGVVSLGQDRDGSIWKTNVDGVCNVIRFCQEYRVKHLFHVSTAYSEGGHNIYEYSKSVAEIILVNSGLPKVTIFRPSIIMPPVGVHYENHFLQFVSTLIRVHRRAEVIRRAVEGELRLPPLRPLFRIKGNPSGTLNLIHLDDVVNAMVRTDALGAYWLTNNNPPKLRDLAEWVGKTILLDIEIAEENFKPMPLEYLFERLSRPFRGYLQGDDFRSDIEGQPVDEQYIRKVVLSSVLGIEKAIDKIG